MTACVLVTGAAGFIGSHVSEALLRRGLRVIGLDEMNDYYPVAYKEVNLKILGQFSNFYFEKADIRDLEMLRLVGQKHPITHIAHLAARAGVRPSIDQPSLYEETNVKGTLNLLILAKEIQTQNFVLTSSSSVYGSSTVIPFREDDAQTDRPISPYAATKKSSELLGYTYHHLYGLNVTVIRPFTVYGPRGRPDMAPWLFLQSALTGRTIQRFGDGSTRRDYTYIADFTNGFVEAVVRPLGFQVINLGNSATVSLNEALEVIERVSGKALNIRELPPQPGDVPLTNADISKARTLLGYDPKTSFAEGMQQFRDWFVEARADLVSGEPK